MMIYQGTGMCKGIAIGTISFYQKAEHRMASVAGRNVEVEAARFEAARQAALLQLTEICQAALAKAGEDAASIFAAQSTLLKDEEMISAAIRIIEEKQVSAEDAVWRTAEHFAGMLASLEDSYMRERAADIRDVADRLIEILSGAASKECKASGSRILCAFDLTPSETISLDKERVIAFATAGGAIVSHTAILARSMNTPAICGLGEAWLEEIIKHVGSLKEEKPAEKSGILGEERRELQERELLAIVDGNTGRFILDPEEDLLAFYRKQMAEEENNRRLLQELKGKENITLDGRKVEILANINGPEDIGAAHDNDAGGIGLFRSEFLYLEKSDYPGEEQQFAVYKKVLEGMKGQKVIIRTLDVGADKEADFLGLKKEKNPALGCRGIRFSLLRPEILKTQLRALYRASVYGKLGILFPMITTVSEVQEIRKLCADVKAELQAEAIEYAGDIELGIMIETPAAAVLSDLLAPLVDFFSIGSNDLTQYTLAYDRQNANVGILFDAHHEAVLRLIRLTVEKAHTHGIRVGICGELAADLTYTEEFLRMGVDELSVVPDEILRIRERVRNLDLSYQKKEAGEKR